MEDFYYGRLRPNELVKPNDPEFQKINQKITESMQILKEYFSEEDFEQVEKLFDLQSDSNSLQSALSFIQGYRMGALMMIGVFNGEKESMQKGSGVD
ncbi:DUF6809 family protein [Paenibacillus sp. IHBB 3054]|uniref:DUF6809 family protein n=1 Tax=Paenibacillus sp. IHBB 3054 TaxID=3425689 RepID=UPI003F672823